MTGNSNTITGGDDNTVETRTGNQGNVTVTRTKSGRIVSRDCLDKSGRRTVFEFEPDGKKIARVEIVRADGLRAVLARDPKDGVVRGTAFGKDGKEMGVVRLWHDAVLLYEPIGAKPEIVPVEKVDFGKHDFDLPVFVAGKYDMERSVFEYAETGNSLVECVRQTANGQVDRVMKDGSVEGVSGFCSLSYFRQSEAVVKYPEGYGATLSSKRDWIVDIWVRGRFAKSVILAPKIAQFIATHSLDPRDAAALIGRFPSQYEAIFDSVAELDRLDFAGRLVFQETLLHDIAFPGQVYQGSAPTCSSASAQCLLAIGDPVCLVRRSLEALEHGRVTGASGTEYRLDRRSLLQIDDSGRSISGRVVQTFVLEIALEILGKEYENTGDGEGRVVVRDETGKPQVQLFNGLGPDPLAKTLRELTGKNYQVMRFARLQDWYEAFAASGFQPMIVNVDASMPPISRFVEGTKRKGHFVTAVGMFASGSDIKVRFHNQWQLKDDRSTEATQVDGRVLFESMLSTKGPDGNRLRGERCSVIMQAPQ